MAHFDLNEQEQIATVKYFWKDWGKYIAAVLLLILGYIGSTGYNWYNTKQSANGANLCRSNYCIKQWSGCRSI